MQVAFKVNGEVRELWTDPGKRLLDVLREDLHLTGTKEGCGEGECGACTVLMDGKPVHACMVLAGQLEGKEILTVEGLSAGGKLHILQQAFAEEGAVQCGFCTPGMLMSAAALLERNTDPTRAEVREALSGNICRCSGYVQIVDAVLRAAKHLNESTENGSVKGEDA